MLTQNVSQSSSLPDLADDVWNLFKLQVLVAVLVGAECCSNVRFYKAVQLFYHRESKLSVTAT